MRLFQQTARQPRLKDYLQWDRKYVWHPFTQAKDWCREPITIIESGRGNEIVDLEGRRYLDGVSSLWCNVHGHREPAIDRAIRKQLSRIAHTTFLGLTHRPAIELARRLVRIAPEGLKKVFYSDSGSAAVEVALKMAFQYWKLRGRPEKRTFLKLRNAYHGDTLGSVSVGGIDLFHEIFHPLLFKTFSVDAPYRYRDAFKGSEAAYALHCAAKVERVLRRHHRRIAAMVLEPLMQGAAGMISQPRGYLGRVEGLCRKYHVLLIADEVATGFGRTGNLFACNEEGVRPDFLCLAKGLTAGYLPLSATLTTDKVYKAFWADYGRFKAFFHGHTYSANPLACAAALANLDLFEKEKTVEKLGPKIKLLTEELGRISNLSHVGDVRQKGMMAGIELVRHKKSGAPYPLGQKTGYRVCAQARRFGVMLRPLGNVIVLMPPLSIREREIRKCCRVTEAAIRHVTEGEARS